MNLPRPRPLAATLIVLAAGAAALNPFREFPLDDDWCCFVSVRHLLHDHALRLLDLVSPTYVAHVSWGALFASVFGLSFGVLRVSTLILAAAGLAVYARVAERKDGPVALSPVFVLMANPLFYVLSFTYMTDVPLVVWSIIALALYLKAEEEGRDGLLLAGSLAASWAYLIRQTGLFLPVAAVAFLLLRSRLNARRAALVVIPPLLTMAAHRWWFLNVHGVTWAYEVYVRHGTFAHLSRPGEFLWDAYARCATALLTAGLFTSPWALAAAPRERPRAPELGLALLLAAVFFPLIRVHGFFPYLPHVMWAGGLGTTSLFDPGAKAAGVLGSPWFARAMTFAGAASLWVWTVRRRELREAAKAPVVQLFGLAGLLMFGSSLLGAKYFDRYLLPLLPAAYLWTSRAAERIQGPRRAPWAASAASVLLLLWSMAGTADYLAWSQAAWRAGVAVTGSGEPRESFFDGLEWNGLHFYERRMDELKKTKPLAAIGEWEWLPRAPFDTAASFAPGLSGDRRLLLAVPYRTPLSFKERAVYVYTTAPAAAR